MPDLKAALTEALREHLTCECGQWAENLDETMEHLADVLLALPGVAVIQLPEPDEITVLRNAWWLMGDVTAVAGSRRVRCELDDHRLSANEARGLAAALLAAAVLSEGETR